MHAICKIMSAALLATTTVAPALADGPQLPAGLAIPARGADGAFQTINSGIGPMATIWHVRSALNVAALSCREPAQASLAGDYNTLIVKQKKAFKAADAAIQQLYQTQHPDDWRTAHDLYMTRLYNFFSQPLAKSAFCDAAVGVASDAAAVPVGGFGAFAPGALVRLEAPFLAVYARYDAYEHAYAEWQQQTQASTAAETVVETAAVAPAAPSAGVAAPGMSPPADAVAIAAASAPLPAIEAAALTPTPQQPVLGYAPLAPDAPTPATTQMSATATATAGR